MRGGKTDLQMAIYLWHNDPNHDRGRATAICYAANAGQKIAIISLAPIFLIAGLVWLLGMNALPMNTLANSVIAALAACGTAFVGTAILWLDRLGRSHGMG